MKTSIISKRFRGFLPVVIDVETAGFNAETDALLEIATVLLAINENGQFYRLQTISCHLEPFPGANLEPAALEFNGIDPHHPFRVAVAMDEKTALEKTFSPIRESLKKTGCSKAILVGHNAFFDLQFINAAVKRTQVKTPFHAFSTLDTVSLGGLLYGQTVLAKSVRAAGFNFDNAEAHSAVYDAERTADLFCKILNSWQELQPN